MNTESSGKKNMITEKVMVFGTFDHLHRGHLNFFKQAKHHGGYLIVVIARDRTVREVKGRLPKYSEKERAKFVMDSGHADEVILGQLGNKLKIIEKHQPDIICLGYDQKNFTDGLDKFRKIEIIRLKSYKPEIFKSSKLKSNV
jgi:FAD synthetase